MKIIVGLGNIEQDYKGTRHNIGFETIDRLATENNISVKKAKFRALVGNGRIGEHRVALVKPQTYMNLSGECVADILCFCGLEPSDLIIIYDDVSLPLSTIRIREKGSDGGHNGIKNIKHHLKTDEFLRIKIGIGEKPKEYDLADYVLSRFRPEEHEGVFQGVTLAAEAVEMILNEGAQKAMTSFNQKPLKEEQA